MDIFSLSVSSITFLSLGNPHRNLNDTGYINTIVNFMLSEKGKKASDAKTAPSKLLFIARSFSFHYGKLY